MFRLVLAVMALFGATAMAQLNPWPYQGPEGTPAPQTPVPTPTPTPTATPAPQAPTGADADAMNLPQFLQQLNSMPGSRGGFGSFPGYSGSGIDASGYPMTAQVPGSGELEACGPISVASKLGQARDEAIKFRNACPLAHKGDDQKIAVNDFSSNGTPYMYIFDVKGTCLYKTAVTYGNGAGPVRPLPCNRDGSNLTPPGMHLTAPHRGGSLYNENNSTLMVGLEGQGSASRGILVHHAKAPGTASSWGCAGVGPYDKVRALLGYGSLVYNYFGDTPMPAGCTNTAGMKRLEKPEVCKMDYGATAVPTTWTEPKDVGAPANSSTVH